MPSSLAGAAAFLVVVLVAIVALAAESPAARARAQRVNPVSGSVALAVTNFPSSGEFCVGDSIAYAITLDNVPSADPANQTDITYLLLEIRGPAQDPSVDPTGSFSGGIAASIVAQSPLTVIQSSGTYVVPSTFKGFVRLALHVVLSYESSRGASANFQNGAWSTPSFNISSASTCSRSASSPSASSTVSASSQTGNSVSTTTTDRPFSATSAPPASSSSTTSDSSSSLASIVPVAAASSGLSTGAIAVIAAAGVALLLCVVAALLLAIYRKRRRQKRLDTTTAPSAPPRYSSSGNDVDCSETVSPSVQISRPSMTHTDLSSTTLDELGSGISSSDPPHEPQKQSLFTVAQGLGVPSMAWRSSQQIEYMIPLSRASNSSTADSAAPSAEPTESTQPTLFTGVLQVVTSLEGAVDKPHKPSPSPDPTKKPLLAHRSWTVQQVADALEAEGVAESIVEQFVSDGVDGARLETVDSGFLLREFGVATAGMRARVMGAVRRVRGEEEPGVGVEDGPTGGAGAEVASPPPYLAMDT